MGRILWRVHKYLVHYKISFNKYKLKILLIHLNLKDKVWNINNKCQTITKIILC